MTWPINQSNQNDALACDPGLPVMGVDSNNRYKFIQLDANGGLITSGNTGTLVPKSWTTQPVPPVGPVAGGVVLAVTDVFLNPPTATRWLQFPAWSFQYLAGAAVQSAEVLFFLSGTAFDTYASARVPWVDAWAPTALDADGFICGVSVSLAQVGAAYYGSVNLATLDGLKGVTAAANIRAVILSTAGGATAGPGASQTFSLNGHYYG